MAMNFQLKNKAIILLLSSVLILTSCGPDEQDYDQLVTITTNKGEMKMILFNDTPLHKKSFLELAEKGAYDSTSFYRVIQGFMIQGGDFSGKEEFEKESRRLIPAEFKPNRINSRGMVGAARQSTSQNPYRHSTTQFYIVHGKVFDETEISTDIDKINGSLAKYLYDGNHEELINEFKALQDSGRTDELQERVIALRPEMEEALKMSFENVDLTPEQIKIYTTIGGAPHLDGEYTVFGKIVEGLEVVDAIATTEVDSLDKPLMPIFMSLKVEQMLKDSLTARYGIVYPPKPAKE
jgi:peptidyl-prolyl cis-trans isomerase B (cyclophilin B)